VADTQGNAETQPEPTLSSMLLKEGAVVFTALAIAAVS